MSGTIQKNQIWSVVLKVIVSNNFSSPKIAHACIAHKDQYRQFCNTDVQVSLNDQHLSTLNYAWTIMTHQQKKGETIYLATSEENPFSHVRSLFMKPSMTIHIPSAVSRVKTSYLLMIGEEKNTLTARCLHIIVIRFLKIKIIYPDLHKSWHRLQRVRITLIWPKVQS